MLRWFRKRTPNPLDASGLRPIEALAAHGDLKAASAELKQARARLGDPPAVRYLEALVYHQGSAAAPAELLEHLRPALEPAIVATLPEARLLEARLLGALGRFAEARAVATELARTRLAPEPLAAARELHTALSRLGGPGAIEQVRSEAEALARDLGQSDLVVRWHASDLARLDSLLDEKPELAETDRGRWVALVGEIACRATRCSWRLALRAEDRVVELGGREWSPGRALTARLRQGEPLYASFHAAKRSQRREVAGMPGLEVVVEPGVHPAVVADSLSRALARLDVEALAVWRERPSAEGPVILPVSFLDKGGMLRAAYIETRPWDPDRLAELRRWVGRLRDSGARDAAVSLLGAHDPPPGAIDLVTGREGPAIAGAALASGLASRVTPRSLDEPKHGWLEERSEMMERLVRASLADPDPGELDLVEKVQQTVRSSFRGDPAALTPKQWTALYGYGALYGRLLGRALGGRWSALADDAPPAEWEMLLPWGERVRPIGRVLEAAHSGASLVAQFLELKAAHDKAGGPA